MTSSESIANQKYRNIIFDLGAVLVSWDLQLFIENIFACRTDKPQNIKAGAECKEWHAYDKGVISEEQLIEAVINQFDVSKEDFTAFLKGVGKHLTPLGDGKKMFYGAKENGFNVYLLTNVGERNLATCREFTPFFNEAHGYIASCEVKAIKPEPDIYQILLDRYSLKPQECLFIDDREDNIATGQSLGIDGIVCKDHKTVLQQLTNLGIIKE